MIGDPVREFYSVLSEMINLYQNKGYLKGKSLYEKMKEKYNWQMSYSTFTRYFNKEIKNKKFHPTSLGEKINTKKNEIIDNNYQINKQTETKMKEQTNENENTTIGQTKISDETMERYRQMNEAMEKNEAVMQQANEIIKKQKGNNNDNSGS